MKKNSNSDLKQIILSPNSKEQSEFNSPNPQSHAIMPINSQNWIETKMSNFNSMKNFQTKKPIKSSESKNEALLNKKINKPTKKEPKSERYSPCPEKNYPESLNFQSSQNKLKDSKFFKNDSRAFVSSLIRQYIKDEFNKQTKKNEDQNNKCSLILGDQRALIINNLINPQFINQNSNRRSNSKVENTENKNRSNSKNKEEVNFLFKKRNPSANIEAVQALHAFQKNNEKLMKQDSGKKINNNEVEKENISNIKVNDSITNEREELIRYNKAYYQKNKEFPPTTLEYYQFIKLIGKGAFGAVTLAIHKLTGKHVAIKSIEKDCLKDEFSRKKVIREITILKKIRHSNIIRLLEVFQSEKHVLIVMEYADKGDLLHYIKSKKKIPEEEAKLIFKQIVYGLAHLHSRNVLHRDIKPDNILLDSEGGIKICDFGVSKVVNKNEYINDQCGTPAYIAPEIITNEVI